VGAVGGGARQGPPCAVHHQPGQVRSACLLVHTRRTGPCPAPDDCCGRAARPVWESGGHLRRRAAVAAAPSAGRRVTSASSLTLLPPTPHCHPPTSTPPPSMDLMANTLLAAGNRATPPPPYPHPHPHPHPTPQHGPHGQHAAGRGRVARNGARPGRGAHRGAWEQLLGVGRRRLRLSSTRRRRPRRRRAAATAVRPTRVRRPPPLPPRS
jgi:hypothetical protein